MKHEYILFLVCLAIGFTACSEKGIYTNNKVNECLSVSVPFPASATMNACADAVVGKSARFQYPVTWEEATRFFSKQYSSNGWTITEESVDQRDASGSAPEATWRANKSNIEVSINLHDFRVDESSGVITGTILYWYEK